MMTSEWVGFLRPSFHPSPLTKQYGSQRRGRGHAFCIHLGANGLSHSQAAPKLCSADLLTPPLAQGPQSQSKAEHRLVRGAGSSEDALGLSLAGSTPTAPRDPRGLRPPRCL